MKQRPWIVAAIIVALVLGYFLLHKPKPDRPTANADLSAPVSSNATAQLPSEPRPTAQTPGPAPAAPTPAVPQPPAIEQRKQLLQRALANKNVPIDFYGKVIDQDSNGLANVKITARIPYWDPASFGPSVPISAETDSQGNFHLQGVKGDGIDIEGVSKDGYELEPVVKTFASATGSPADPVVFKMWSTNIHEKLITGRKSFPITPDGRSYFINLAAGTIAESGKGDLKVWVKRPDPITRGQRYDWSCGIDVVNGGLLQEPNTAAAMYRAPSGGYTNSFRFEQAVGSGWGDSTGQKKFYVSVNGGKEYGRISIELYAFYNAKSPGMVRLDYVLNPSGSLILR